MKQPRFTDAVTEGVDNTGTTDNTSTIAALLASNARLYFRDGTYLITPRVLSFTQRIHIRGQSRDGVILKMNHPVAGVTSDMIVLGAGAEGSVIENLTFDGDKATHLVSYNHATTQFNGWRGLHSAAPRARFESITFQNFISSPCWTYGDEIIARHIKVESSCSGIYFGELSGPGPNTYKRCVIEHISSIGMNTDLTGQAGSGKVYPHAIDVFGLVDSFVRNLNVEDQDGLLASMASPQISAITIAGCERTVFDTLIAKHMLFGEGSHAAVTVPYNIDCMFNNVITRSHNGVGIELVGGEGCSVSNFDLDGEYNAVGSNAISSSYGISVSQRSIVWSGNLRAHWQGGRSHRIFQGSIRGFGDGIRIRGGKARFTDVEVYGNYNHGLRQWKPASGSALGNYSGDGVYAETYLRACNIHSNGRAGIGHEFGNLSIDAGTRLANNNQRNCSPAQGLVTTADLGVYDRLSVGRVSVEATQHQNDLAGTAQTIAEAISFNPHTTTSRTGIYKDTASGTFHTATITLLKGKQDRTLVEQGQNIILKAVSASNMDTPPGRIVSIDEDFMTVLFSTSQTLLANSALLAAADTISTQSAADQHGRATLTGSHTSWLGQFTGGEWLTDGSEWRQLVAVASDTSITISASFATKPASIRALRASIETVPPRNSNGLDFATAGFVYLSGDAEFIGYIPYKKTNMLSLGMFERDSVVYLDDRVIPDGTSTQAIGLRGLPEHELMAYRAIVTAAVTGGGAAVGYVYHDPVNGDFMTVAVTGVAKNSKTSSAIVVPVSGSFFEHKSGASCRYSVQHRSATSGSIRFERKIKLRDLKDFPGAA